MVPEQVYEQEQGTPMERALLLVLQRKYEHYRAERKRAKATLLVMGRNPYTGERDGKGRVKRAHSICKGERTRKGARNSFSKEEMGTIGNYVGVCRWDNSYITKACYRKKLW